VPVDPWLVLGWVAFGLALTAATDWLVATLWGERWPGRMLAVDLLASGLWVVLLAAAGLLAMRYVERIAHAWLGYLLFGGLAFALSLLRAVLYQRVKAQRRSRPGPDWQAILGEAVHSLLYLLAALGVYLLTALLARWSVDPMLFIPLGVGALLPDLDSRSSLLGRVLPFVARPLEAYLGHRGAWHTPLAAALVAALTAPLIVLIQVRAWWLLPLGFLCHLAVDVLTPQGVMLLWPWSREGYRLGPGFLGSPGSVAERWLAAGLAAVVALLLVAVDLGPPPAPPVAQPTYEQSLDRYRSIQGRNLALADVDGAWQADGRRVTGRFEILNALGSSYVMLDRYTGRVFRAGRAPEDHLYLHRITVLSGAAAQIKPAEVHLEVQALADALPVVYQMQREEGLQHIFVSGDVVLPPAEGEATPALRPEYPQTRLPRVEAHGGRRYRLNYLTAAELIALATVRVETADLVVVATSVRPAPGPTVTPLPSPPATLETP
jgi:inner membrane protein